MHIHFTKIGNDILNENHAQTSCQKMGGASSPMSVTTTIYLNYFRVIAAKFSSKP